MGRRRGFEANDVDVVVWERTQRKRQDLRPRDFESCLVATSLYLTYALNSQWPSTNRRLFSACHDTLQQATVGRLKQKEHSFHHRKDRIRQQSCRSSSILVCFKGRGYVINPLRLPLCMHDCPSGNLNIVIRRLIRPRVITGKHNKLHPLRCH